MAKLWAGRFEKPTSALLDDFQSSISFDQRLLECDVTGSIAHATMLGEQGIIPREDAKRIVEGLRGILDDYHAGTLAIDMGAEDVHMFVEALLTDRIGEAGKRLHTGRSRNDQVALDVRMYARGACRHVREMLLSLLSLLSALSKEHLNTVMPGYTHLQKAQPVTLAFHLMAYAQMFMRDVTRFEHAYDEADVMPLGSGALAGTTYPLNRDRVRELLGFSRLTDNALDGVSDRDFLLSFLSAASIAMMHLSRFCEELILWSTNEFSTAVMDDSFATGSSIMPQKKNPDACELTRGKNRPRLRSSDGPAHRDEGPSPGLQQGHAGGQGSLLRRLRHALQMPAHLHRDAAHHILPRRRDAQERGAGLHQRHRSGGLPGGQGRALPRTRIM